MYIIMLKLSQRTSCKYNLNNLSFEMNLVDFYGICPFHWVRNNDWGGRVDLCAHKERGEDIMPCDATKWSTKCPFMRKAVGG